nr:ribonuclease H-like domain, reverse transcriptase, RNA-dependent DNA polymerase [Tanacetum cinerariifolium]
MKENGYATKAKELGKTLDKSLLVRKLLDSTHDRFNQIVASIEQINDLDDITLDEFIGKLKAFEERIKLRKEGQVESQENLLFAHGEHSGKERRFSKCGGVEEGSKACRLYDPKGKRKHVSRDVRFMETKPWDWDNNGKETSTQDTFWASFVVEGADNENPTPVNIENNDNTYQEQELITDPDSPITPPAYTYNPNSKEEEATISSLMNSENQFDDTPIRAKGYVQEQGLDFDEVFAPVDRIETVRFILALAAYHGWQVHHLDVKSAFLHEDLKEEVYVTQPEGFIQQGNSEKSTSLLKLFYTKRSKTSTLIVGVYVDDLIIMGTLRKEIDFFKCQMEDKFEMSDLGLSAYYIGIEVTQTGGVITIRQTGYINKILKETSMIESNDTKIPMNPGTKLVKAEDGNSVDATYYRSLIRSLRAACQALWLKRLLSEITGWEEERITLKVDNISAIALVRNQFFMKEASTSTFAIILFENA